MKTLFIAKLSSDTLTQWVSIDTQKLTNTLPHGSMPDKEFQLSEINID